MGLINAEAFDERAKEVIRKSKDDLSSFFVDGMKATLDLLSTEPRVGVGNKNLEKFLELVQKNPGLPIVPLVDSEVVADDTHGFWMGSWGYSEVKEIYVGETAIHFRDEDDDDVEDVLCDAQDSEKGLIRKGMTDKELEEAYGLLPWRKAVCVYICTPELY